MGHGDVSLSPHTVLSDSKGPLLLFLSLVDCLDPQCAGHGVCVKGECLCSPGWGGTSCESPLPACQDQCSGHGTYMPESGTCVCEHNWTGSDCYIGKRTHTEHNTDTNTDIIIQLNVDYTH